MGLIVYGGDSPTVKLQEVKIRKDNDFKLMFLVERNGNPEDMEQASIVSLKLISPKAVETLLTPALIKENVIYLDIESTFNTDLGKYRLEMKYTVLDPEFTGGVRDCAVDTYAYTIVSTSAEATIIDELAKSVDVATGFQGKAFTFSMYTAEQIAELKRPALEAAQTANASAQTADDAAQAALSAKEAANTATQEANEATQNANDAATTAQTCGESAQVAAASANAAASDAYQKAVVARQEAEKAQIAASAANQARIALAGAVQTELQYAELKIQEVDQAKAAALGAANTANAAASDATTKGNLAETKAGLANDAADNADQARALLVEASDVKMGQVDEKIQEANTAISNANAKAAEANNAAGAANDAAGSANEAATTANTAAGLADTARTELTTAVNTKMGEADGKIEEMNTTLSTYDGRVTQVESDIDQLAGDVKGTIEMPIAHALSQLKEEIDSLRILIEEGRINRMQIETLDVISEIRINGSPLIYVLDSAPSFSPDQVPQFYIDTSAGRLYAAKGTGSANDWF